MERKGKHPVNSSGGLIGVGHPVGATGVRMLRDLNLYLTGQAGKYQVDINQGNVMLVNLGGTATTTVVVVVGLPYRK